MAIRGGGLKLPTSKCHALVVINTGDPTATEHFVEVKVSCSGFLFRSDTQIGYLWAPGSWGGPLQWMKNRLLILMARSS
jgi:hypothetical protein